MTQINSGLRAFPVDPTVTLPLVAYTRVKQGANGLLVAGPFDGEIGILEDDVLLTGDFGTVRLPNVGGTRKVICASTCSAGDRLFPTTLGQFDTFAAGGLGTAGAAIGPATMVAIEACPAAGALVEALPFPSSGTGLLFVATTDGLGTASSTAENAFTINQVTLPANDLRVGDVLKIRGRVVVTNQNSTDTIAIKLYLGAVVLASIAAFDPATNDEILIAGEFTITAIGASGKVQGSALFTAGAPGTATAREAALQSTTIDTTAVALVKATATWSASSANDVSVLRDLTVQLVRQ